jgi:hypothetical protein
MQDTPVEHDGSDEPFPPGRGGWTHVGAPSTEPEEKRRGGLCKKCSLVHLGADSRGFCLADPAITRAAGVSWLSGAAFAIGSWCDVWRWPGFTSLIWPVQGVQGRGLGGEAAAAPAYRGLG